MEPMVVAAVECYSSSNSSSNVGGGRAEAIGLIGIKRSNDR